MSYIATKLVILVPILNSLGQVIKKWLFPDDLKRTSKLPKLRAVFLRLFPSKKRIRCSLRTSLLTSTVNAALQELITVRRSTMKTWSYQVGSAEYRNTLMTG